MGCTRSVEDDPLERDQLTAAAQAARARAEELAGPVEQLRIADDARSMWLIETATTRDKAESARVALGLDDPGDRVTAQEWIDADTTATLAADAERVITEHDIDPATLGADLAGQAAEDQAGEDQPVDEHVTDDLSTNVEPPPSSCPHRLPPQTAHRRTR